jgi:uncharacterized protein (TIGR00251 family)
MRPKGAYRMLEAQNQDDGILVEVRVQPKSSADRIMGEHNGALKIGVTSAPEGGKANAAVVKLLSRLLRIPKSNIEIVSGAASRNKRLKIRGVSADQVRSLL